MKKKFNLFLHLVVALLLLPLPLSAQQRIKFKPGATQATVTGRMTSYKSVKKYVLRLRAGQTLEINQLRSDNDLRIVRVGIYDPQGTGVTEGDASCGSFQRVENTVEGDYTVEVTECQKADEWRGPFRLQIKAN